MWTQKRRSAHGLIRHKFRCHKKNAAIRGIKFHFTFEEWVKWWEVNLGPDWAIKRGRKEGQYVMGRLGDTGPYHPDNVICITTTENSKMAREGEIQTIEQRLKNSIANRGEQNHRAKLNNSQVIEIFNSNDTTSALARRFGVSRPVINGIRKGKNWSHVVNLRRSSPDR